MDKVISNPRMGVKARITVSIGIILTLRYVIGMVGHNENIYKKTRRVLKMIRSIATDQAPAAIGPYSQAIFSEPFLFVSGQIGLLPGTGELTGPDFDTQARQSLENMKQILEASGCRLVDVLSVDVFLIDMEMFSRFNAIYESFFNDHRPARAVIAVAGLPKGALVEIKCVAKTA